MAAAGCCYCAISVGLSGPSKPQPQDCLPPSWRAWTGVPRSGSLSPVPSRRSGRRRRMLALRRAAQPEGQQPAGSPAASQESFVSVDDVLRLAQEEGEGYVFEDDGKDDESLSEDPFISFGGAATQSPGVHLPLNEDVGPVLLAYEQAPSIQQMDARHLRDEMYNIDSVLLDVRTEDEHCQG
eukprot:SM000073S21422  [mRNA]  locus=s73:89570:90747:- [translate_table: standard]